MPLWSCRRTAEARIVGPAGASIVLLAALVTVSGCSSTPEYQRPSTPQAEAYRNSDKAGSALPAPSTKWWEKFECDELNLLVNRALTSSYDLKAAAQRVVQADQLAKMASASMLPTLSLLGSESVTAPAGGIGSRTRYNTKLETARTVEVVGRVSYEVDLWGKNSAGADAAIANAEASVFDRQTLTLSLVGDVVTNYLTIMALNDLVSIAETGRNNAKKTLTAIEARASVREATQIELSQQRAALARSESQLAGYRLQLEQTQNQLSLLLGASPTEPLNLTNKSLSAIKMPEIESGIPSDLLLRRPDISKTEAVLRGANANIGVARAKFLPSFSLTGDGGRGSFSLASLLSPQSLYASMIGSVAQSIFDGGRAKAEEKYSEARYEELVNIYRQAVLNALREVENSLAGNTLLVDQENADLQSLEAAKAAYTYSSAAFNAGRIEYQTLLETERTQLSSQQTAIITRLTRLRNSIALFKALGGDISTPMPKDGENPKDGEKKE